MKSTHLILLALLAFFITSCENANEPAPGNLEFAFAVPATGEQKSFSDPDSAGSSDGDVPFQIMISVTGNNGELTWTDKMIRVYRFGQGFVTEKTEIPGGNYQLTKFMVLADNGNVIYAAPLEGSPKSFLVSRPLPLEFSIIPGESTRVDPEVLKTQNSQPSDFGYASFTFTVIDYYKAWVLAMEEDPLYYGPVKTVPAKMTLIARNGWSHTYNIRSEATEILVPAGYEKFRMIAESRENPPVEREISAQNLRGSTKDNPFLIRFSRNPTDVLYLQPGPEEGKDAMITDLDPMKNFGDHPYFETSFLTEPVLTVMRTKRSLMYFDLKDLPEYTRIEKVYLTLHFDRPLWDTLIDYGQLDSWMLLPDLVLQQIVEPWQENKVTWGNQPSTIEANQVSVPFSLELDSNVRIYDVTSLFVPVQEIAAPNYGMMFRFVGGGDIPGGMQFASSDHPVEEMRPVLEVHYYFPED